MDWIHEAFGRYGPDVRHPRHNEDSITLTLNLTLLTLIPALNLNLNLTL